MNREGFQAFIDAHEWTYAKTMPKWPHHYTTRDRCRSVEEFEAAVLFIRAEGYNKMFYRSKRCYMNHTDGHFYWTMGDLVPNTLVINRATFEDYPDWPKGTDIKPGTFFGNTTK
jgi:hypothetical protein